MVRDRLRDMVAMEVAFRSCAQARGWKPWVVEAELDEAGLFLPFSPVLNAFDYARSDAASVYE